MHIRQATYCDIDRLMVIFDNAKAIMRNSGNMEQWNGSYPSVEVVRSDIDAGNCFVLCDSKVTGSDQHEDGEIIGTMALIPGPDPTYGYIEGQWDNDEPYYVIHRIATYAPGRRRMTCTGSHGGITWTLLFAATACARRMDTGIISRAAGT